MPKYFSLWHGWDPYLSTMGDDEGFLEVGYKSYSINSHALGYGDPIRVQKGQKVIFRIVNASATLLHRVALSGHSFTVLSLDGNPVPTPRTVDVLELGPAERVDAVVTMNRPGVWTSPVNSTTRYVAQVSARLSNMPMRKVRHSGSRRPSPPGTTRSSAVQPTRPLRTSK